MIKRLLDQVRDALATETTEENREPAIRLATAVLLADVAQADDVFDETEFDRVLRLMESHFELAPNDAAELVNQATEEAESLVSLHAFTDVLHQNLDEAEKARVVRLLWNVAYADGNLDKYEDSLVLKISDLLHVSRGQCMRLKHDAMPG